MAAKQYQKKENEFIALGDELCQMTLIDSKLQ